jgi:hypothetical protein
MAVTVYIFAKDRRVRVPLGPAEAQDLIHDENEHKITISVRAAHNVQNGEHIGFICVDGRFRLFTVTNTVLDDDKRVIDVTATDAIVQDMKEAIIESNQQLDVSLLEALAAYIPDDSWVISGEAPIDRLEKSRAYYTSLWEMITTLEQLYEWKIDAYYLFDGAQITGKALHMRSPEPVFRGRIFQSGRDASKVLITSAGRPITRLYGLGKSTGTEDEPSNLTFADVVWSKANGDPVDKPKGQTWVEDPEAVEEFGVHTDKYVAPDAEDPADLLKRTWEELQRREHPTVSIKATVADLEMVDGYTHQQIRLGDLVAVCLKSGETVEAKIIAIKRHYFKPWLTVITIGEKTASIQTQVASLITNATHTFERLTIYKNRFQEDEALIQLNAEHIQLNATTIIEHAKQIALIGEDAEQVKIVLDGINDQIALMAGTIQLNADKINLQADEILLKADKTYVDDLVAKYVTAEEVVASILEVVDSAYVSEMLETADLRAGGVTAVWVSADGVGANNVSAGSLSIGGNDVNLAGMTVVTNASAIFDDSGNVIGLNVTKTPISFYQ